MKDETGRPFIIVREYVESGDMEQKDKRKITS
jgi:hypothetical protein